jgi:hypothetical protein
MGGLFKGPKPQKSSSGNHAWNEIETYFQPTLGYTSSAGNMMASLLGVGPPTIGDKIGGYSSGDGTTYGSGGGTGGSGGQGSALDNWANSGGMQFLREQGNRQINSNQAAKGLMNSGSTLTSLTKYGQGLGSTYLNQYMDQLGKLASIGLGSGNLMAQAGQWSKGTGAQQAGAGKQLGQMIATAAIASDPRLKYDSKVIGYLPDGLPVHEFRYRQDTPLNLPEGKFIGVMADEVAVLRPEALGGTRKGYQMLSDSKLAPRKVSE